MALAERAEHFTNAEKERLGRIKRDSLILVKDFDSYYCRSCGIVYGTECPNCHVLAPTNHGDPNSPIVAIRPLQSGVFEGYRFTRVECRKCDYRFRVLIR